MDFFERLAAILALSQFGDVTLNALLGDLALDLSGRALCVDNGNLVFVHTRGSFLEEVPASTTKYWGAPVDPPVLLCEYKG